MSLFDFQGLAYLSLSSNNLSGSFKLNLIQQLINPSELDLSHNELSSIECYQPNSSLLFRSNNSLALKLSYNRLKIFPDCLRSQSNLIELDLSNNQIHGEIPNWIWKLPILTQLNLSYNHLVTMEESFLNSSSLVYLDLSSNQLQGPLPVLASPFSYLDFSGNNFSSTIPANIGSFLAHAFFFSLSKNKLHGSIPVSICNGTGLLVLDLSENSLSGSIPQCLMGMCATLKLLNLGRNHLTGTIFNAFPSLCSLKLLALDGNQLKGELPKSLANCTKLEVLDIGNNHIEDIFPCPIPASLGKLSNLESLDLSSNKLTGKIPLQLADGLIFLSTLNLSFNQLVGKIPMVKQFTTFPEKSYEGNRGLCGFPLEEKCEPISPPPAFEGTHSNSRNAVNWNFLSVELGFIFGFGIVIVPLVFWRRWRIWYYTRIDDICFKILPQCYFRKEYGRRRVPKNQG
ncbi:LRR receptor-like serine/threonine-protein kinase GSO1 [Morella rubra]|uniref:LRR receptor-like serine/threonine-protein kinase GSO1 n=1 Tax=Morella rubra TaxID=262757 RepID=A0A6A1VWH6_9ROSI|nr:LRR receptor-like serine/threonine-protein kinase GSO1 [Morella rubra]